MFFDKYYIKTILFINIEVFNKVFVNKKFVKLYNFFFILLQNSIKLYLINNKFVSNIIYITQVTINLDNFSKLKNQIFSTEVTI